MFRESAINIYVIGNSFAILTNKQRVSAYDARTF